MSLHYVIDGYNVIKQVTFLTGKKLRTGRESLIRFIERYRPHGKGENEVTVVFDGKAEVTSPQMKTQFRIVFSKNESADDVIKRMVERASNPKEFIIVSDDKAVALYCRSIGAKWMPVKEFIANTKIKKSQKKKSKTYETKDIPEEIADKITDDLKKLWLNKDNG